MITRRRTMWNFAGYSLLAGSLCVAGRVDAQVGTAPAPDEKTVALNRAIEAVQRDPGAATTEAMTQLLTLSRDAGRPQAAAAIMKNYLAQRREVAPELLVMAAETAERAGDLRTAVARYKQYVKTAPASPGVADATLRLFRLLVDSLGAADDAYRLMTELGDAARATPALKRYDAWYLAQANQRRDTAAVANRLAAILSEGMPLEMERAAYWDPLDWLMTTISGSRPDCFGALPGCRKLVGLIRENDAQSKRLAFLTAHVGFVAGLAGKDAAAIERDFEPVAAAARAYIDAAPTGLTVHEIARAFGGVLNGFDDGLYMRCFGQKAQVYAYALGKLSAVEREKMLGTSAVWNGGWWPNRLLTKELGAQVVAAAPDFYRKSPNAALIPLPTDSTNPAVYKALAPATQGIATGPALIVTALGTSDDLYGCWQRVVRDGWFFSSFGEVGNHLQAVWSAYSQFPRDGTQKLPGDYYDRTMARFGAEVLAKTPLFAFDANLARTFASAAWRGGDPTGTDKGKVTALLHLLDWVPYTEAERKLVFEDANREFRGWADWVRNQQRDRKGAFDQATKALEGQRKQRDEEARKPTPNLQGLDATIAEQIRTLETRKTELAAAEALAASISSIEAAFKQVMDVKVTDLTKAPDDLCRNLARAILAQRAKDLAAFQEAARAVYPGVRDFSNQKPPLGRAILTFLLRNRLDLFDTVDLQCEVFADQLTKGTPESGNTGVWETWSLMNENRQWLIQPAEKPKVMKINGVLAKALRDGLARNQFSEIEFEWFRGTRRTQGWQELGGDLDLMEAVITRKDLIPVRQGRVQALMNWLRNDFPKLAEKYPPETAFDTLLIEEAKQTRYLDRGYFENGGRDATGLVVKAAAELYQTYERLPFGYGGPALYPDRERFWDMQGRAMGAPPAVRDAMLTQIESCYGKTRFDYYANGGARLATLTTATPEARKKYFDALAAWVAALKQAPVKAYQPSLGPLAAIASPANLTSQELDILMDLLRSAPDWNWGDGSGLDRWIHEGAVALKRQTDLFALAPALWALARQQPSETIRNELIAYAGSLADAGRTDLAATYAACGLEVLGPVLREDQRNALLAIKSKGVSGVLAVVAVDRADKRFPMFQAQADYQVGKYEEAWQTYLTARALYGEAYRELAPEFSIWLIGRLTDVGSYTDAEATARLMIQWVDQAPQSFDPEDRARLLLAYAQISFARQEYPRARAICEQVAAAKEFDSTQARRDADLRIAEIDRLTKHFDKAIERLEAMLRRKDAYIQAEANYQLALVKFDQEEYPESRAYVDKVLAVAPAHANARILGGKLYLRMKKLVEATDVRVGLASSQETLVPGRPLKVSLEDRNLGIVGQSANIEIRAWADSGDEEFFTLLPFGDSKTKFEGQIPTALAALRKGDKTLQVLGGDLVHFDFSDAFKKANKIAGASPANIRVVADGELYISSGRILTREEQEQRQLEALIRQRMQSEARVETTVALSTLRADDEVKPGNPINVRVVDPDECTTPGKNKVRVKVAASSGDRIESVMLAETAPYTGVFEGQIPTASALATAFASDSEEGKAPNFAITSAEYPAWTALPDNRRPKSFSVDLNNNVGLGHLKILADVPGRKLKKFIVQASPNGEDFSSLCAWPANLQGWLGAGQLEVVRYAGQNRGPATLREYRDYLDVGYTAAGCEKVVITPPPLSIKWDRNVNGLGDRLQLAWDGINSWYLGHLQLAFNQPARAKRVFRLGSPDPRKLSKTFFMTLDGEVGPSPREVSKSVTKGMHRLDVYFCASRQAGINVWLETDSGGQPQLVPCTPEMFSAATNAPDKEPAGVAKAIAFQPAVITNSADNGTFDIAFPSNTMARMIRLWLLDFETDAPAIRKLFLTSSDGKAVLPTPQDVVKLRENNTLEIVPGDRITVTYEDPHFLTKQRQFSEAFMKVTFHNATLSACFIDSDVDESGNRRARYIPMRRFKPGDAVNVFVQDADCDTSEAQDLVKLRAQAGTEGRTVTVDALETEAHSGIFLAKIFPVTAAPQRASEIQLGPNDDLIVRYTDAENTDPGIPWDRVVTLEQTYRSRPELRVYDFASRPLTEREAADVRPPADAARKLDEVVPVTRSITAVRPEGATHAAAHALLGCPLVVELTHPEIAQSPLSRATFYVQTASGRAKSGKALEGEFDLTVPGTVKIEVPPGDRPNVAPPPGYRDVTFEGADPEAKALDDGRFTCVVPLRLGPVPATSLVDQKPVKGDSGADDTDWADVSVSVSSLDSRGLPTVVPQTIRVPVVKVRGDDTLFIGYSYRDEAGSNRWQTASATVTADAFFDVMERRYQETVTNLHVGETLYLRVINPGADRTDDKDVAMVQIKTGAGIARPLTLSETFGHSGIFKGVAQVLYVGDPATSNAVSAVRANYGDTVLLSYAPTGGVPSVERSVFIYRGDNGAVMPFTKRFKDASIAVQTQFTVAEAYFEMAKKHRDLGQEELARREIGQGKKLLEEAIRDYPNTDARAQADYLLAELALEFAAQNTDNDQKTRFFLEAVSRFTDIVATYPDSPYAPKAQFKKALTYEKMGRIDEACEEYVKLSYRYPDNELVAETIARLGQYFLTKGKTYQEKMAAEADPVARERVRLESVEMYKTAAQVFGRLAVRFPDHKLASKTSVLSGQCYMRAEDFERAIAVFTRVIDAKKADSDLLAEAMYWCGDSYMKGKNKDGLVSAYRMFKKLTWDYPETVWAKYARGRLSEDALAKLDSEQQN